MTLKEICRKALYYRDMALLCRIFLVSLRISLAHPEKVAKFADVEVRGRTGNREKITRYVGLCLRLRARFGMRNTCLTHSVLLARMLRGHGMDAKVNFGVQKNGGDRLAGHCWVTIGQEEIQPDWMLVCRYPPVASA